MTTAATGLAGSNLIAGKDEHGRGQKVQATDPSSGEVLPATFHDASADQVDAAAQHAVMAITDLADRDRRARLLCRVAAKLTASRDALVDVAHRETGLPLARLANEVGRAATQFEQFATVVADGTYLEAHLDSARGADGPDVRRLLHPIGPVAVFGASNFPFAFSVAGGDTASALAAGCPVVAKAHPAHPGTSELSARVISDAVAEEGIDRGVFSLVHGVDHQVGLALVQHPEIAAVGFTGSERGGRALFDAAAARPRPIPVYAELGSTNPAFVTTAAMRARGPQIAADLAASITLGTGQFCTKPGVLVLPDDAEADGFVAELAEALAAVGPQTMLTRGIQTALHAGLESTAATPDVEAVVPAGADPRPGSWQGPGLYATDLATFRDNPVLREERFGPVALAVRTPEQHFQTVAALLEGVLAASVYLEDDDHAGIADLWAALEHTAGRIVVNDVPTGVAVVAGMHHGGPYPASTSPLFTSVGHTAIRRFLRPVAYQNAPQALLPDALRNEPAEPIWRTVDGSLVRTGHDNTAAVIEEQEKTG